MYTETPGTGCYVVSDSNNMRSRESGKLGADANEYIPGTVVALVGDEYVRYDGTNTVAGVLYEGADASDGPVARAFHVRDCEVNGHELYWSADGVNPLSASQVTAGELALADLGIIVRH